LKEIAKIAWRSPSNIAFIKYWGKHGIQLPMNPSFSMTLDKCTTETSITILQKKRSESIDFDFLFHGAENTPFSNRIGKYLNSLKEHLSFLHDYKLLIESENNFPHSAGIASSASAMSALALCLTSIEQRMGKGLSSDMYTKASHLARLGSGSASRSIFREFAVWGNSEAVPGSSDEFAMQYTLPVHSTFQCLRDTILIIDKEEKKVSSSAGHSLMNEHPYAKQRFQSAGKNLEQLVKVMSKGDFNGFAYILEHEALSIHAMMMTAKPWYTLLSSNTLKVIQLVKLFRENSGVNITFTIDAGPNVHLIYPAKEDEKVKAFIKDELLQFCHEKKFIADNIGMGPELLVDEFN
jgi:diphosphomevalonate decarboxylase